MQAPDAMNPSKAIELRDVTVELGGRTILHDFSLSLATGEKALLTGASGCGKSTVLRCLLGFVVPQAGAILIQGEPLNAHSVWQLRRHLAYVSQEPDLGAGTAREALEWPFSLKANAALRGNLARVPELMKRFGLAEGLLGKEPGDLSGGEKQRFALIAALLLDRRIFLLDEVTSALDRQSKQIVLDYFRTADDVTALFVAHDAEWFSFASQIIEMPVHGPIGAPAND